MPIIRTLSWNVNGLRAVARKGFLDWFARERPDILCLQETKAAEEQLGPELRAVPGYQSFFSWPSHRKGYSGVALYTRTPPRALTRTFDLRPLGIAPGPAPLSDVADEGRMLTADYGPFVLCNVYFPNGRSGDERLAYKMRFYDAFLEFSEALRRAGKHVVVCGDVNTAHKEIDIARPKENSATSGFLPQERAWVDKLVGRGYVDTFRMFNGEPGQYTWWDMLTRARERNVGWRIDCFFVNQEFARQVKRAWIMPDVMGSDHCPVGLELELP